MTLGNCYAAAGDYLLGECLFDKEKQKIMQLVHGRVTRRLPPHIKFGHAWIEIESKRVIDPGQQITASVDEYYRAGDIDVDSCIRYTYKEMASRVTATQHWGPWDLEELPEEAAFRAELGEAHG